jgi:hypothetical protein
MENAPRAQTYREKAKQLRDAAASMPSASRVEIEFIAKQYERLADGVDLLSEKQPAQKTD